MKKETLLIVFFTLSVTILNGCDNRKDARRETSENQSLKIKSEKYSSQNSPIIVKKLKVREVVIEEASISNQYISLQNQMKYALIREKYRKTKKNADEKEFEEYKIHLIKLGKLYNEYSNRWDEIENEKDRFGIVFMLKDEDFQIKILENLVDNGMDVFIAQESARVLAIDKERKSRKKGITIEESEKFFQEAIDYYERFEERILGNNEVEDIYKNLSEDDRKALSTNYGSKGIAYYMKGDYDSQINCFEKSALLKSDLFAKSQAEDEVADAYALKKDKKNVIEWLEKARNSWQELDDEEMKAITYPQYEWILQKLGFAKKGELMTSSWGH